MRRTVLSALLVLLPAIPGSAQQDTSWQIYLDRPATVGDRCSVVSSGSQVRHTKSSLRGQAPEDSLDSLEVNYAATHEILAVGKNGSPTRMRLTINRLETNDGSGPQQQFAPGTVLEAQAEGDETRFFLRRDELEGTLHDALNLAGANLGSVNEPSEDEVFKNRGALNRGSRLQADPKLLGRAIQLTTPFLVDAGRSSAEVVLENVAVENSIPSLVTQSKFDIALRGFKSVPGQPLMDSFIRSSTKRVLPIDPALPLVHESLDTDMRISSRDQKEEEGARKDEGEERPGFTTTFHRKASRDITPLPQAPLRSGEEKTSKS